MVPSAADLGDGLPNPPSPAPGVRASPPLGCLLIDLSGASIDRIASPVTYVADCCRVRGRWHPPASMSTAQMPTSCRPDNQPRSYSARSVRSTGSVRRSCQPLSSASAVRVCSAPSSGRDVTGSGLQGANSLVWRLVRKHSVHQSSEASTNPSGGTMTSHSAIRSSDGESARTRQLPK